jgi:hypothetical protein
MCSQDLVYQQFDLTPDEFDMWKEKWWARVYSYYENYA